MNFIHKHKAVIDSTNSSLWTWSEQKQLPDFYCLTTDYQTHGKGQDLNVWESEKGANILMSCLVYPQFLVADQAFQISRWVALSLLYYLQSKSLDEVKIKWPNDIYVGHQKIAGVLIQNAISGMHLSKSMFGIGLNVNQVCFHSAAPNPVSLKQLTNIHYQLPHELEELMQSLQTTYQMLREQPEVILLKYAENLYQKDEYCDYEIGQSRIRGKIKGVDQFGRLRLELTDGKIQIFDIKEIRFL